MLGREFIALGSWRGKQADKPPVEGRSCLRISIVYPFRYLSAKRAARTAYDPGRKDYDRTLLDDCAGNDYRSDSARLDDARRLALCFHSTSLMRAGSDVFPLPARMKLRAHRRSRCAVPLSEKCCKLCNKAMAGSTVNCPGAALCLGHLILLPLHLALQAADINPVIDAVTQCLCDS